PDDQSGPQMHEAATVTVPSGLSNRPPEQRIRPPQVPSPVRSVDATCVEKVWPPVQVPLTVTVQELNGSFRVKFDSWRSIRPLSFFTWPPTVAVMTGAEKFDDATGTVTLPEIGMFELQETTV